LERSGPPAFELTLLETPLLPASLAPQNPYSWANSLLVHLFVLTALLLPFQLQRNVTPTQLPKKIFDFTPLQLTFPHLHGSAAETHGGGGSGNRSPFPASRGALPPFARTQFTPPIARIPDVPPILPMPATLIGPPELKLPAMKDNVPWGDPKGVWSAISPGPGTGGVFGSGDGTGVGPGEGPGYGPGKNGGCCGGAFEVGPSTGVSAPIPIYAPEPTYSEEARKAKFGGIVMLSIIVDAQGQVRDVHVVKRLGLNLDEKAEEAIRTWKFKPGIRQGVPVPVHVLVEVSFRLF
jgi:TonB family protein